MIVPQHDPVELLILGAGWTSTFLIPLLEKEKVRYAATTTTGRDGTIPFKFDPDSDDDAPFRHLPTATTVLITFPLKGKGPSARLARLYKATRASSAASSSSPPTVPPVSSNLPPSSSLLPPESSSAAASPSTQFIQLGATSIWKAPGWQDDRSPYDETNARAIAEDELMSAAVGGATLDLAGLYGGARQPAGWVDRVIRTKDDLRAKGALHLIHGADVARAILALHRHFTPRTRWLLCDLHVYDWWDLVMDWATRAQAEGGDSSSESDDAHLARQRQLQAWVGELMLECDVQALPRDSHLLGRRLDGRAFWREMGIWPSQGRVR